MNASQNLWLWFPLQAAIEAMREIDTLIVDKTGTLTEGKTAFDRVVAAPSFSDLDVLQIAASIDQGREHPLAHTVVDEVRKGGIALDKPETFESSNGIGVRGAVKGRRIALGNTALMDQEKVDWKTLVEQAEELRNDGASVMYLAADGQLVGLRLTLRRGSRIPCRLAEGRLKGRHASHVSPVRLYRAALRPPVPRGAWASIVCQACRSGAAATVEENCFHTCGLVQP
jgi:hypothetical protein